MKPLLLILSLVLYQIVSAQLGGWSRIDPATIANNPTIQNALTFGARQLVERGIQSEDLPDADYDVTGIYSVESQVAAGMNYQFDVELTNDQGIVVRADYVVYVADVTNEQQLISSQYYIEEAGENYEGELGEFGFLPEEVYFSEEEQQIDVQSSQTTVQDILEVVDPIFNGRVIQSAGGWSPVSLSDAYNDPDIQAALSYGIREATAQGIRSGRLPNQTYRRTRLISVQSQVVSGMNYRFNVNVRGNRGAAANLRLVVYSQVWTDTLELTSSTIRPIS